MSRDIRRELDELGSRPVPPPDPAFADALEARLLAVAATLPEPVAPVSVTRRPRARAAWWLAGLAAAAVVVLVAAGVLLAPAPLAPIPGSATALEAPVNVSVVMPNGDVLEDPDGLMLPAGAVVSVGAGGSARIGTTVLGPGDVATVGRDRVVIAHPSPGGTVVETFEPVTPHPTGGAGTPRPDHSTASGGGSPTPSMGPSTPPSQSPSPVPSPSPSPSPDPSPRPTPQPTRTPAPTVEPTVAPTVTPQPTPTPTPLTLRPLLRARLIDGPRIRVTWTETWRAQSYVLLASVAKGGQAPDPVYPGTKVLGVFAAPPALPLRYRVPAGVTEVRLMVVALRADGTVLRRSRIVTIEIPLPAPSPSTSPTPAPASVPTPSPAATPTPTPAP